MDSIINPEIKKPTRLTDGKSKKIHSSAFSSKLLNVETLNFTSFSFEPCVDSILMVCSYKLYTFLYWNSENLVTFNGIAFWPTRRVNLSSWNLNLILSTWKHHYCKLYQATKRIDTHKAIQYHSCNNKSPLKKWHTIIILFSLHSFTLTTNVRWYGKSTREQQVPNYM
jgi:hypothetical protein